MGKVISILPPTSRKLFWQGVEVEVIDISSDAKLPPHLVAELLAGSKEVLLLTHNPSFVTIEGKNQEKKAEL